MVQPAARQMQVYEQGMDTDENDKKCKWIEKKDENEINQNISRQCDASMWVMATNTNLMIISISVDLRILCTEFYLYHTYRARILCEEYNIHMYLCPYVKTWYPLEGARRKVWSWTEILSPT